MQVQALAQATIQELHGKLAVRGGQVEEGQRRLAALRASAAAEVQALQTQLQHLTQQAQQQDQRHIKVGHCLWLSG